MTDASLPRIPRGTKGEIERLVSRYTEALHAFGRWTELESDDPSCVNYKLCSNKGVYFVKTRRENKSEQLKQEMDALSLLREKALFFLVPLPIVCGSLGYHSFLVMEYVTHDGQGDMASFGKALAEFHSTPVPIASFGFDEDNHLGDLPQKNEWTKKWGDFFCNMRLQEAMCQLKVRHSTVRAKAPTPSPGLSGLTPSQMLPQSVEIQLFALISALRPYLNSLPITPSLVHGDLWSGNYGFTKQGRPVMFDPACYYGHRWVALLARDPDTSHHTTAKWTWPSSSCFGSVRVSCTGGTTRCGRGWRGRRTASASTTCTT